MPEPFNPVSRDFAGEKNNPDLKVKYPRCILKQAEQNAEKMGSIVLSPHPCDSHLNLLLEAVDQFAVRIDQGLIGFDFGDDGLLSFERWEGNFAFIYGYLRDRGLTANFRKLI